MRTTFVFGLAIALTSALLLPGMAATAQKSADAEKVPTLEELVSQLQDTNMSVRWRTLGYIGAMKPYPKEITPHVIRLLKDPDYNVRAGAANALGNLQNALPDLGTRFPACIPQLITMLADRDPEDKHQLVRRFAAYALRHLGASSKAAVPALLKIATDKEEIASVRTEAVQALGDIGDASDEVVAALTKLLGDPTRINENYPTIGNVAKASLSRLEKRGSK